MAERGGFELARVGGGDVRAVLEAPDRVRLEVRQNGWTLRGVADPGRDRTLRLQRARWLSESVGLRAGRAVRVLALEGDRRLRVGLSDNGPGPSDGVRWVVEPTDDVSCEALGLGSPTAGPTNREALWVAAEIDRASLEAAALAGDSEIPIASAPGDSPFAFLAPRRVRIAARQPGFARVVLDIRGHLIVGWVEESAVADDARSGGFGGLGLRGRDAASTLVCSADEPLALYASSGSLAPEPVGTLDAGARFVRLGTLGRGRVRTAPHPRDHVDLADGVLMYVTPTHPPRCAEEQGASPGPP